MIAIHIHETDTEIIVGQLDTIIARYNKFFWEDDKSLADIIKETIEGLGYKVEIEAGV